MADSPPESAFADLVVEFLDTATHQILYQRGIYPQRVFTRLENTVHCTSVLFYCDRRHHYYRCSKFGVPVLRSEHPRVNQFIGDHLRSVHEMMESGSAVCRVDVAVLSNAKSDSNSSVEGTGKSLHPSEKGQQNRGGREDICESFAFRFHRPASFDVSHPSGLGVVESNFRTMLLKLNSALASLPKLGWISKSPMYRNAALSISDIDLIHLSVPLPILVYHLVERFVKCLLEVISIGLQAISTL